MATIQDLQKNAVGVHILGAVDIAGGAKTGDYINMSNFDAVIYGFNAGIIGNTATLTITQCTQDADAGGDSKAIGTGKVITLTATTDNASTEYVRIDAAEMDCTNNFRWLKAITNAAAAAVVSADAICYRPRYAADTMPSAIS